MKMADEFADYVNNCEGWRNITKAIKQRPHQTQSSDDISMLRHTAGPRTTLIPQRQKHSPEQLQPLNYINITNWSQEEQIAIENE